MRRSYVAWKKTRRYLRIPAGEVETPDPVLFYSYAWTANTNTAAFGPRDGAMAVHYGDKYWLLGGWNSEPDADPPFDGLADTTNEVWSSEDLETWTLELAHEASPPTSGPGARWKRRHWFGCFTHTHNGTNYLYVCGGDHESAADADFSGSPSDGYQSDIWRTTDPAGDWERVLASNSAPFAGRTLMVFGSGGGSLWAFGGQDGLLAEGTSTLHNDLWQSTDGGANWTQVFGDDDEATDRPGPGGIINKLAFWNGRMWLVGGGTYDTTDHPTRIFRQEVWSFDPSNPGAGWTRHETPPWPGRQYNSVEVLNGRLFCIGGYTGINTREVWSTSDGDRWERHETPAWAPSHADGTCVNGLTLVHVAGNGGIAADVSHCHSFTATPEYEEVTLPTGYRWRATDAVLSGSNITNIPDANGSGVTLVPTTGGDATYTASDADFGGVPVAVSDGGAFLHTSTTVDLSSFTLFIVAKPTASAGLFYHAYALLTGPVRYAYFAQSRTAADLVTLSMDVLRGGVSTTGSATNVPHDDDLRGIYVFHYDGTAAGSRIQFEDAKTLPDTGTLTSDAGTDAFSATLYLYSDNSGAGSKAVEMAEARLYPVLTKAQREAVVRELREAYPYAYP